MALFDTSVWKFFISHGLDENYFEQEHMGVFALKLRKAVAMPQDISQKFDAQIAVDQQLDWEAPVSGAIQL